MLTARIGGLLGVSLRALLLGGPAVWFAVAGAWAALPGRAFPSRALTSRGAGLRGAPGAARDADPPLEATLVFATTDVDVGQLEIGESRRVEVPWRRQGVGPLRVQDVFTGCGCVVAGGLGAAWPDTAVSPSAASHERVAHEPSANEPSANEPSANEPSANEPSANEPSANSDAGVPADAGVLEEGATGTLLLELAGHARVGPFTHTVRVATDRLVGGVHTVRVRGFVGASTVVSPAALLLGEVRPDERVVRWITVRPPPGRPVPSVDARFTGVNATLRGVPPGRAGAVGWDLEVTLTAPAHAGPFAGAVELRLGDDTLVRVPIDGVVEGKP